MQETHKINGILRVLNELNSGEVVLKDLAADMGLHVRTLQRYINTVEIAGFPLYCPRDGVYSFIEGYSLQKMRITGSEACLLVLMDNFVNSLDNDELVQSFKNFRTRALQNSGENPFYVKFGSSAPYKSTETTKTLEKAIKNNQVIDIVYNGNDLTHLKPVKIANFEGFWYLICLGNKDKILKFKIAKIEQIKVREQTFKTDKRIEKVLNESGNIWFEMDKNIEVQLNIRKEAAKYFKSRKYFPSQKIEKENTDGSIILTCKVSRYEEIVHEILHWIPRIRVISPKELADIVEQKVKEYLNEK